VKGRDMAENIAELAEAWYKGEFELGYYNFYICTTAEGLIQKCRDEHKIKVTRSDIENMCKLDLLEYILDKKDGKKMFPQFIADRVAFIKELQAHLNYPIPRLQQIVAYENEALLYSNEVCDFYYADRKKIIPWLIKRLKFELEGRKEYLKALGVISKKYADDIRKKKINRAIADLVKNTEASIASIEEVVTELSKWKWKNLSGEHKDELVKIVFEQQFSDEQERMADMKHYYNKILSGYSPQVEFKKPEAVRGRLDFRQIDWDETIDSVKRYAQFIDFFTIPYFSVEIDGKVITIKITNPKEVNTPLKGAIDKIYTVFKGRFGYRRKGWGERSGKKHLMEQRNEKLRELYSMMRKEKPNVASGILIDRLIEETKKTEIPVLSTERIKRIIYTKNMS
jgi:hypothetical protein